MQNDNEILKKKLNVQRLGKVIFLKKKNNKLAYNVWQYMKQNPKSKYLQYLQSLYRHLVCCDSFVLMKDMGNNDFEFVSGKTCKDKLCHICNYERRRMTRSKYIAWFKQNPVLYQGADGKIYTRSTLPKHMDAVEVAYDNFHLTLTVPHTGGGYKGKEIYYRQIISDFNRLRKTEVWQHWVLGGEYGVEATKDSKEEKEFERLKDSKDYMEESNGFHIHIHALVFARKGKQNRNIIHRAILLEWNNITKDKRYRRQDIPESIWPKIRNGNSLLTDEDIRKLSPKGATMITFESMYEKIKLPSGKIKKVYCQTETAKINGVMETVSYHFKPRTFENKDGSFNVLKIAQVYANTKGMIMYRKFGVLHKESCLNIKDTTLIDELEAAKEAEAAAAGVVVDTVAMDYFVTNPLNMWVDDRGIHIKDVRKTTDLMSHGTTAALAELQVMLQQEDRQKERDIVNSIQNLRWKNN